MSNEAFDIKKWVGRTPCNLILCTVTDQSLSISKDNTTWGGSISLMIGNYFHFSMLDTHTRVGGAKINATRRFLRHDCLSVSAQLAKTTIRTATPALGEFFSISFFLLKKIL